MAHEHHHHHCCCCEHDEKHEHDEEHEHEGHEHGEHDEHGHHHNHDEEENPKTKIAIIAATVVLLIAAILIEKNCNLATWQLLLIYMVPYLLVGWDTIKEAVEGIMEGDPFNENFLMVVATIGALCIGFLPNAETEFPEAVFVMLFFQVGELFEGYAEGKSRESISHLMDIRPDSANVERDGEVKTVAPDEVEEGETIVVKPGEKIPLDGVIIEGQTSLNTIALTGESAPRDAGVEDEVISGCINLTGVIRMRTTKTFGESTVSKIIDLVENASEHKSESEAFITKFARVYTPIVVICALVVAFIPPFFAAGGYASALSTWLYRALTFLVVSCPCALVISIPLAFFGGIGGASRNGILIKGSNFMDVLSKVDTVVMDKTGTLTHGVFEVEAVHTSKEGNPEDEQKHLLHLAAHVEHFSSHPIAAALRNAYPDEDNDGCKVENVEEIAGHGIRATVNGDVVCVGNQKMMESIGAECHQCHKVGTIIHVAINGQYAGHIVINDRIKSDSKQAIADMKALGVSKTVMLTGDRKEVGESVAKELGLDAYYAELLPTDKVSHVEELIKSKSEDKKLAFVGDGINDAPVLARADVGIAMGGLGSDAAIEAADVVLMDDQPSKIALAIRIARRTITIARQNVIFAIGIKVAILILAAFGIAKMGLAVFGDVGVMILAVLNAMRALRVK